MGAEKGFREKLSGTFNRIGNSFSGTGSDPSFVRLGFIVAAAAAPFSAQLSLVALAAPTAYYGVGQTLLYINDKILKRQPS